MSLMYIVYDDNYLGQLLFMLGVGAVKKRVGISWYSLLNVPDVHVCDHFIMIF